MNRYRSLKVFSCSLAFAHSVALAADPLPRGDPAKAGFSPTALQRIDRFFADEIARDRIPGAVVAIAREGRLVYYKTFGFQDKQKSLPMRDDTIFQLASMTKPMAVVGALTLL
jgi:CubicO group peptidase (beta-lactamase class C family)